MYATPLPVTSEVLLTHSCGFGSPPKHETASRAACLTLVCDQSTIELLVGRLRGRWSAQLRLKRLWNVHFHSSLQRVDVLDHEVNVLLLVPVGRPEHGELCISMFLAASLILIASPVLSSLTVVERSVWSLFEPSRSSVEVVELR